MQGPGRPIASGDLGRYLRLIKFFFNRESTTLHQNEVSSELDTYYSKLHWAFKYISQYFTRGTSRSLSKEDGEGLHTYVYVMCLRTPKIPQEMKER